MAALTTEQRLEVRAVVIRIWSARGPDQENIPVTKSQLATFIGIVDDEMDASETDIFDALPPGAAKTWLQGNQNVGRRLMEMIENKRREVF